MRLVIFIQSLFFAGALASSILEKQRDPKVLSLFSVVTFPNQGCTSTDSSRNGTCFTSTECSEKGGKASGNCAAGFGVCCLFTVSAGASQITQNCTYIQNPSFPSVYSDTTSLRYTINKCSSEVCQVRLDFETFNIAGPAATTEATGGLCVDSFVVTGTSGLSTPVICGLNTGEHIYIEMGATDASTATIDFTFAGASTIRNWEIKATQVSCFDRSRAPDGCLQYLTTNTGRLTSFNFQEPLTAGAHLGTQRQQVCIRQNEGMCCVKYNLCSDTGSWGLHGVANSMIDSMCTGDFVEINGVSGECVMGSGGELHSKLCGNAFNVVTGQAAANLPSVCDCTAPFQVNIVTDNAAEAIAGGRGVCLEYQQVACG